MSSLILLFERKDPSFQQAFGESFKELYFHYDLTFYLVVPKKVILTEFQCTFFILCYNLPLGKALKVWLKLTHFELR